MTNRHYINSNGYYTPLRPETNSPGESSRQQSSSINNAAQQHQTIIAYYYEPPVSSSTTDDSKQQSRKSSSKCKRKPADKQDFDLSKFQLKPFEIPDRQTLIIHISLDDLDAAHKKLLSEPQPANITFWEDMYYHLFKAFTSKYNEFLKSRPKFLGIIDTVLFALVAQQGSALDKLKRMRRYLTFKQDPADSIRIKSAAAVKLQNQINDFFKRDKAFADLMRDNVVSFFSMSELLQNISAPEDIAFTGTALHDNFPMPMKFDRDRKVQAVRVKLHKPTLVHLIKVHLKSPWKVGHEDSQKIVASLTKAAGNQWIINQDIVVNKPETGDKKVFSILYKNPITPMDVCKNYNVVLIDHLYVVPSKNNEKRLNVVTSPMLLDKGDPPVIGFNLFGPDEAMMKQKRKVELDHAVLDGPKIKKSKLNK